MNKESYILKEKYCINTDVQGCAFTVTARYGAMCATNVMGGGHYPMTAVAEEYAVVEQEMIPLMAQKVGDRGKDTYFVHDYSNCISSNPMSDREQVLLEVWVMPDPRKSFGVMHQRSDIAATLLATDYKSPPLAVECISDNKTNSMGQKQLKDVANFPVRCATAQGYAECPPGGVFDSAYPQSKLRRGRVQEGGTVTGALTAAGEFHCLYEGINQNQEDMKEEQQLKYRIRKLTPRECFRLMDVDDADIDRIQRVRISDTEQYRLAGNSIVVACMELIMRNLFIGHSDEDKHPIQLSLF